jgi:predicted MFS family arabinose efflux permease
MRQVRTHGFFLMVAAQGNHRAGLRMSTIAAGTERGLSARVMTVLVAGCAIATIGFGVRVSFGFFLTPMTEAHGWSRETFAIALAVQNLLWGIATPIAGALADRFGVSRVLAGGAVVYALGVVGFALAESSLALYLTAGLVTGLGVGLTSFSLAMAAMAKVVGPERRSLAFGLGTAFSSFGMVLFSPIGQGFISAFGWQTAMMMLGAIALLILPLALLLPSSTGAAGEAPSDQTIGEALKEALAHRGYVLLNLGFFVCGFHIAFITVHFPAYVRDLGLPAETGAIALALIGLCNIVGSFVSGLVGQRRSKKSSLSVIYFARAVAIMALLLSPKTGLTIYVFAAAMGFLWLATVPLTTGIVAQVFGARYMATLFGVVFLSHQLGSFIGVWLGGYLYDTIGSYDPVWWAGVILGLAAAFIHLPIDERPLARLGLVKA